MDGTGFDALTRAVSGLRSRRGVARALLGAILGTPLALPDLDEVDAKRGPSRKRRQRRAQRQDRAGRGRNSAQADKKKGKKGNACPPCKKRKQGKCKKKLPDGTACSGGTCQGGSCIPACTPSCAGRSCGPNGCGGNCGTCPGALSCQDGQCVLACTGGLTACAGNCVDLQTDLANCGACGEPCNFAHASATCQGGACVLGACDAGFANCDGNPGTGCEIDIRSNDNHCGSCNSPCRLSHASARCQNEICTLETCDAGWGDCDEDAENGCETNLDHDLDHCGACGNACDRDTQLCDSSGTCVDCDVCTTGCRFGSVQEAIDAATPGDTIRICAGTWDLTSTLVVDKNLSLVGAGADHTILDGNDAIRVLRNGVNGQVPTPVTTIRDLTIARGRATGEFEDGVGGGLLTIGTLTLVRVTVRNNIAADRGGGIRAFGTLTLDDCTVTLNRGGVGGGIAAGLGTVILQRSHVTENTALSGGGIFVENVGLGTLTLIDSSVTGNTAETQDGGGLFNYQCSVTLTNSTISGNIAQRDGGGISNRTAVPTNTPLRLEEGCMVEGNRAGRNGGGIYNLGAVVLESNGRVEGNTADQDGGGIYNRGAATLRVGSRVAGNSAGNDGGGFFKNTDISSPPTIESFEADNIVTDNHLTDGTTLSNCAPVNTIPNCIG